MVRHRHTRGLVLDLNSEVSPDSYLDNAKVGENADVYASNLIDSWADHSIIVGCSAVNADIRHSHVTASTVADSDLIDCKVFDSVISGSTLDGCTVRGGTILDCEIDADVVVGRATLEGLVIKEPMRIGTGHWRRVPRSFEINTDDISGVTVTESTDGHAYVGCQRRPIRQWIKGRHRYGKVMGWDTEVVDYITSRLEGWLHDEHI